MENASRRRLLARAGVGISPTAKVNCRNISLAPGSGLRIGRGSIVEARVVSERNGARISIGNFVGNSLISCAGSINIGDDVLISWGCNLVDHNSHAVSWRDRQLDVRNWYAGVKDWSRVDIAPVEIGPRSWLGFNVGILRGVKIGEGAVVGAGSIVTRDVPPWCIVAGNPAKVIREISIEER
jgi:galactoside O-acetyltransferase